MQKLEPVKILHIDDLRKLKKRCPNTRVHISKDPYGDVVMDHTVVQCRLARGHGGQHTWWTQGERHDW